MTFQPNNDLWGPEDLRGSTPPALCARKVIKRAVASRWSVVLDRVPARSGPFYPAAVLARLWRAMLSRKLEWAAFGLELRTQCAHRRELLSPLLYRLRTHAAPATFGQEVDFSGPSCL